MAWPFPAKKIERWKSKVGGSYHDIILLHTPTVMIPGPLIAFPVIAHLCSTVLDMLPSLSSLTESGNGRLREAVENAASLGGPLVNHV